MGSATTANTVFGISATGVTGNADAIQVTFAATVVATQFTLGVVTNLNGLTSDNLGAVLGTQVGNGNGFANPLGSVPLGGSSGPSGTTPGTTQGPALVGPGIGTAANDGADAINGTQVVFTYNEGIGPGCVAGDFWAYTVAGNSATAATNCVTTGSNQITVTWTAAGFSTSAIARYGAIVGAVAQVGTGFVSPEGWTQGTACSLTMAVYGPGCVGSPYLSTVASTANPNVFDFTYSGAVNAAGAVATGFLVYPANFPTGAAIAGNAVVQDGANTIAVTFAIPAAEQGLITLGANDGATVTNGAVNGVTPVIGDQPITISTSVSNVGQTSGPDLTNVAQSGPNTVQYTFDKAFVQNPPNPAAFFVLSPTGTPTFGATAISSAGGTVVTVSFASSAIVSAADAAGVEDAIAGEGGFPGIAPVWVSAGTDLTGTFANSPGDLTFTP